MHIQIQRIPRFIEGSDASDENACYTADHRMVRFNETVVKGQTGDKFRQIKGGLAQTGRLVFPLVDFLFIGRFSDRFKVFIKLDGINFTRFRILDGAIFIVEWGRSLLGGYAFVSAGIAVLIDLDLTVPASNFDRVKLIECPVIRNREAQIAAESSGYRPCIFEFHLY